MGTPTLRIDSIATHGDVSGHYYVPVLKDGDSVLRETHDILAHLDQRYDKAAS